MKGCLSGIIKFVHRLTAEKPGHFFGRWGHVHRERVARRRCNTIIGQFSFQTERGVTKFPRHAVQDEILPLKLQSTGNSIKTGDFRCVLQKPLFRPTPDIENIVIFTLFHVGDLTDAPVQPSLVQPVVSPLDFLFNKISNVLGNNTIGNIMTVRLPADRCGYRLGIDEQIIRVEVFEETASSDIQTVNVDVQVFHGKVTPVELHIVMSLDGFGFQGGVKNRGIIEMQVMHGHGSLGGKFEKIPLVAVIDVQLSGDFLERDITAVIGPVPADIQELCTNGGIDAAVQDRFCVLR